MKGYELYSKTFSESEKESITKEFIPKIKNWVQKVYYNLPKSVDIDELYSSACLGLVESFKRFDKNRNVDFKIYAERRIKGAIMDCLRQLDMLPRNLRTKMKQFEAKVLRLTSELGRKPNAEEIATHTGIELSEVYELLNVIDNNQVASLNTPINDESETDLVDVIRGSFLDPHEAVEKNEMINSVISAINTLSEKEKMVITLYYYEELNMKEIGEAVGITESRVSQLHSSAVKKMRKNLKRCF